ncbi:MAG: hypothetical protein M4579_007154 [Chaenotheca gracillima]|nr:MAG: hypothetical protein M4579_007154 [Chaenotheca gracillima]
MDAGSRQRSVFDSTRPRALSPSSSLSPGPRADVVPYSDALPSINYLHFDKIKAEDQRHSTIAGINMSTTSALVSPTTTVPSGPPPPYSYPSAPTTTTNTHVNNSSSSSSNASSNTSTASSVPAITGLISPPESRRTSGDEKEPPPAPPRQSLPSIFEALGEPPLPYGTPVSVAPPAHHTSSAHLTPSTHYSPTTSTIPRSHPEAVQDTSQRHRFNHPPTQNGPPSHPHASSFPPPPPPLSTPTQSDTRRVSLPSAYSQESHSHAQTLPTLRTDGPTARSDSPAQRPHPSPRYEQGPASATSMHSSSGFGGPYQHQSYPPPQMGHPASATSSYHSPSSYGPHVPFAARFDGSEVARVQEAQQTYKGLKGVPQGERYGNSVKRHLEFFDLEASLNEIADHTGRTNDFARSCIGRVRQSKIQHEPGTLPSLTELDTIIQEQDRVRDLFARMREMLLNQANTLHHANQASRDPYHKSNGAGGGASGDDYQLDDPSLYNEDGKAGGLLGPEAKKRRGPLRLADVTAVIEPRRPNGVAVQMEPAPSVTHVVYTTPNSPARWDRKRVEVLEDHRYDRNRWGRVRRDQHINNILDGYQLSK